MKMDFNGKTTIVTGGAQGIGKGISKYFLQLGATVIIADSDEEAGLETQQELEALGKILFVKTDVANEKDIQHVIHFTIDKFNQLDYLINNAGISVFKSIDKLHLDEWNRIISINLTSVFLFSQYALPYLQKAKGAIVNIASTRALMSEPDTLAYSASKGGLVALTHSLAISLGPDVRVNCISPGWIETSAWKKTQERHLPHLKAADLKQHPVGRVGKPEDIAYLAAYLVSDQASFITGENFIVDGGMTKKMIYV